MKTIRMLAVGLIATVVAVFVAASSTSAQTFESGDSVTIPASRTIDGMLFTGGTNVVVDGTIKGNLYCAGQTITIRGVIDGNVYCAAQTITMDGKVHGSIHLAGQSVTVGGIVDEDATLAGQSVTLSTKGVIGRDLLGGTQSLTIEGAIGRDSVIGAERSIVSGTIGRNLTGEITKLTIGSQGQIKGNVDYVSTKDATVEKGGTIGGTIERTTPKQEQSQKQEFSLFGAFMGFLYTYAALLLVAFALVLIFPRALHTSAAETMRQPGYTVLTGFLAALIMPGVILLSFITIIGIPLAFLLIAIGILIALLSTPFAAYLTGHWLLRNTASKDKPLLVMLLGITVVILLYAIPIIGFFAFIATYLFGTGMLIRGVITRSPRPSYELEQPKEKEKKTNKKS